MALRVEDDEEVEGEEEKEKECRKEEVEAVKERKTRKCSLRRKRKDVEGDGPTVVEHKRVLQ